MSICLILLPVALAIRVVMGKENFENWVGSMQLKIPTAFENENDLTLTVRKAAYDADKWGGSIKTHIRGEAFFFFWENIDGVWTAVFSKNDPQDQIKDFIRDLEKKSGRQIFQRKNESRNIATLPTKTFPTNFRDPELLKKALTDYGLSTREIGEKTIQAQAGECLLTFQQVDQGSLFNVAIKNAPDVRQMYEHLNEINEGYCHHVQSKTYETLTKKIAERGLTVEHEEVLDDNSIVITLNIG